MAEVGACFPLGSVLSSSSLCFLQSNLKTFAGGRDQPPLLFDELALHLLLEHHQQLEHLSLKQQFNAQSDVASSLLLQPHAQSLRAFPVSFGGLTVVSKDEQQRGSTWIDRSCYGVAIWCTHVSRVHLEDLRPPGNFKLETASMLLHTAHGPNTLLAADITDSARLGVAAVLPTS